MSPDWSLATVKEARAYWVAGALTVQIAGETPDPCYFVDVERNLLQVEPPEFVAKWRRTSEFCPEVLTPYEQQRIFSVAEKPATVRLHHADGVLDVSVEGIAQRSEEFAAVDSVERISAPEQTVAEPSAVSPQPRAMDAGSFEGEVATGYSKAWDFAEAFRNAIDNLPKDPEPAAFPDQLTTYEVVSVGAVFGGIAGFDDLWVEARRRSGDG